MKIVKTRTLQTRISDNNIIQKLLFAPIIAVIAITFVSVFQAIAMPLINQHRDVLKDIKIEQLYVDDTKIILKLFMDKKLDVFYVKESEQGYVFVNGFWKEAEFEYINDVSPGSNRPVNLSKDPVSYGIWKWSGDMSEVEKVKTIVQHLSEYEIEETVVNDQMTTVITGNARTTIIGPFVIDRTLPNNYEFKNE